MLIKPVDFGVYGKKHNNEQMTLVTNPILKKLFAETEEIKLNTNNFIQNGFT